MVPSQLNSLGFINPGLTLLLSVLSLSLSRLSSWRGFLPRRTWTHPLSPPLGVALLHLRFVFVFSYVVLGSTLPTPRSTPAWFCTSCCHFDGCFRFLLCLPSVCSVASYIQYLIQWFLCRTPFTRITFLYMAFSKPWFTHMLWLKL